MMFSKDYIPILESRMVTWNPLNLVFFKCNSDGASKENPDPSSGDFCIKNKEGDFVYVEVRRLFIRTNQATKVVALRLGLEHCVEHNILPVMLETNFYNLKNILDVYLKVPWSTSMEVKRIRMMKLEKEVVDHTPREGKKLVDFSLIKFLFCRYKQANIFYTIGSAN